MRRIGAITHGWLAQRARTLRTDVILAGLVGLPIVLPASLPAHLPVLCPFRALTGLPCPSCGLTRSFIALGHLQLGESLAYHPLGPLCYALVVSLLVWRVLGRVAGRVPIEVEGLWGDRRVGPLLRTGIVLWLSWAAARAVRLAVS
jgi:hypothetical protein